MPKKNHAVQFSTVAKALLVSLFLGGSGVGYVIQKEQIRRLLAERERQQDHIIELEHERMEVESLLAEATDHRQIKSRLARNSSTLGPTAPGRIVKRPEPDLKGETIGVEIASRTRATSDD